MGGISNAASIQRVTALNLLLDDLYHEQKILQGRRHPGRSDPRQCQFPAGNARRRGSRTRPMSISAAPTSSATRDGVFRVLEDNARTPSGVSYVIENRHMMLRAFPDLLDGVRAARRSTITACSWWRRCARSRRPAGGDPQIVLLSPGIYNSAYFEHVFLAREMGVPLVEGRDLAVENDRVYMRTIGGLRRVDVIYRRINDDFLDPEAFRPDSMLGVPGLMRAYRAGNVALANAIGTGVADDKAVYAYMPRIIRYYLDEDAGPAECRDPYLPRAGEPALHARAS